jgi:hypothetical protein
VRYVDYPNSKHFSQKSQLVRIKGVRGNKKYLINNNKSMETMDTREHIAKEPLKLTTLGDEVRMLTPDMEGRFDSLKIRDLGALIAGLEEVKNDALSSIKFYENVKGGKNESHGGPSAGAIVREAIDSAAALGIDTSELEEQFRELKAKYSD